MSEHLRLGRIPERPGVYFCWKYFHWQVAQESRGLLSGHGHDDLDLDDLGRRYASSLKAEIDTGLRVTKSITHPRSGSETGGPGVEFDFVALALNAFTTTTTVAGIYQIWKAVASDIREATRRVRRISKDQACVDTGAALVLAVDAIALPNTFADLELRFIAPLNPTVDELDAPRGYLVAFANDGVTQFVIVSRTGEVIGIGAGEIPAAELAKLGL